MLERLFNIGLRLNIEMQGVEERLGGGGFCYNTGKMSVTVSGFIVTSKLAAISISYQWESVSKVMSSLPFHF